MTLFPALQIFLRCNLQFFYSELTDELFCSFVAKQTMLCCISPKSFFRALPYIILGRAAATPLDLAPPGSFAHEARRNNRAISGMKAN